MANQSTFILLLLSVVICTTQVHAFWTSCLPHKTYFDNVQQQLQAAARGSEAYGLEEDKTKTHPTLKRILQRLDTVRSERASTTMLMERYTAQKLSDYSMMRLRNSADMVHALDEVLQRLDFENDAVLEKLQHHQEEHKAKQKEAARLQRKMEALTAGNIQLEQSIKQRNETLTKANATLVKTRKIAQEQGFGS